MILQMYRHWSVMTSGKGFKLLLTANLSTKTTTTFFHLISAIIRMRCYRKRWKTQRFLFLLSRTEIIGRKRLVIENVVVDIKDDESDECVKQLLVTQYDKPLTKWLNKYGKNYKHLGSIYTGTIFSLAFTACGPVNRFTRVKRIPREYAMNYCGTDIKASRSIWSGKAPWVVFSDQLDNFSYRKPTGKNVYKELKFMEPYLVIKEKVTGWRLSNIVRTL